MKILRWMGPCGTLWLVLLTASGCPDSETKSLTDPPPDTAVTDVEIQDWGRRDAPPPDAYVDEQPDTVDDVCPAGGCVPPSDAPDVRGEPSAGHPHPTWLWDLPEGAVAARVRLDGGPWGEVPDGVTRQPARSPLGNVAAISAHNCYLAFMDPATSLEATRTMIQEAVDGGADLIELDIKAEGGEIFVDHDDDGSVDGALLADVLDLPELQAADQLLYIEIKENEPADAFIAGLLDILDARREHYAHNGRPVVLRTFLYRLGNVALARQLLDGGGYPLIEHYVRLSVLFNNDDFPVLSTFQEKIAQVAADGYGMVEFHYRDRNLMGKVAYARSLDLGVNLWTIPKSMGPVFTTGLREEVDAITTDLSVATARAAVEADNVLIYLNSGEQPPGDDVVTWNQADGVAAQAGINGPGQPSGAGWGTGVGLFGTVLLGADPHGTAAPRFHFDGAIQQAVVLRWGGP